jgi:PQQ-dependent dehydrogenase (methanol/ethanol family)
MNCKNRYLRIALATAFSAAFVGSAFAADVDGNRVLNADKELEKGNWITYHGSYKSWHYSPLTQINTKTVGKLTEAWSHTASRANRGLQGFPLAIDGVLYYSSPYNQVYALDGATGHVLWTYKQKLNEDLVARQTHSPYNRGLAAGYGQIFMGTLDGKLAAIDAKTGKLSWETKLIDSEKLTVGFTGAPLLVKDKIIIGAQGGEWPYRGPIFGVNAKTGEKVWEFDTAGGNDGTATDKRDTWGNDSWKVGGGGGWMAGAYDPETNSLWWGTANPAPLYDWAGSNWKTEGPRPGDNLYTSSVLLLDPDTGDLKAYHQEIPHDAWDFDAAMGEFVFVESGGKKYVMHPNKGGFDFVYDRHGKPVNVYKAVDNINFVKDIKPNGELVGRRDLKEGKHENLCPAIAGGQSWNSGTYSPKTGLAYRVGYEWCQDLTVLKTEPITEPVVQLNIGADFTMHGPGSEKPWGHIRARDPVSGKVKFQITYKGAVPHASLLSTAGNVLFVPEADGTLAVYDATNGKKLWTHNDGQGHDGGIITYLAKGKQYVAVMTGWGSLVGDGYGDLWGEPWKSMPKDSGVLKVFALQ